MIDPASETTPQALLYLTLVVIVWGGFIAYRLHQIADLLRDRLPKLDKFKPHE
jgi:hypothetical protein